MRAVLLLLISAGYAFATPVPTLSISDERTLPGWLGSPVGNVRLDGKNLTSGAIAQQPKANRSGWVGWVDCSDKDHPERLLIVKGVPSGSRLILRNPSGSLHTILAGKPIIEAWGFDSDGLHVVVKSRALHGPAVIERFLMKHGVRDGQYPAYESSLPPWAVVYRE